MTPTLVPVSADDREFLLALYASTRAEELKRAPWDDAQKDVFVRTQFAAQERAYTAYENSDYRIVLCDGQRAGRLYVARWLTEIRIVDIALLPAFRGHGVGAELLRVLLAEGKRAGLPVRIHVEKENPALRLYRRLGFRDVEDKGVYLFLEHVG